MNTENKKWIYLDDIRTPKVPGDWVVVRSYDEFVETVDRIGFENIALISLDHDLGPSAMAEWHTNVYTNYTLDYNNITEKTGYDCAKWLVEQWIGGKPFIKTVTHSANAIGAGNITGLINNYCHIYSLPQTSERVRIEYTTL